MQAKRTIIYLTSFDAHLPYLVVSLRTLRNHWDGPIRVYAWPESIDLVEKIAEDERLGIQPILSDPEYRARRDERRQGKNDQFIHKVRLFKSLTDVEIGLYLDADTSVHGDLSPLFLAAENYGFCATRFSNWFSTGGVVKARIERLREFPDIEQKYVEQLLQVPWFSVNGGVWAARPDSPVLDTWEKWTWAARSVFIADEAVLHCLQPKYWHRNLMVTWPDGRFNCSCNPKWRPEGIDEERIVVWHYHGDSNVRPQKHGGHAYRRWTKLYEECLNENVGGVRDWEGKINNRWMKELKET